MVREDMDGEDVNPSQDLTTPVGCCDVPRVQTAHDNKIPFDIILRPNFNVVKKAFRIKIKL